MSDNANRWKPGAFMRYLILLPALVVAVSFGFTGAASAQTAFQAHVTATSPLPAGPCPNTALICGTANIAGYGAATWDFYVVSYNPVQTSCGSTYTATTVFTLADGSTLTVNEGGYLCGPGKDARSYFAEGPNAFGHPYYAYGTWTVGTATGQFAGLLGGSGSDTFHVAGAHASGSYTGTP